MKLAKIYAEETPSKIQISQGTNRYWNGHLPTRAAIQMAAITGNVGKQYANVNWAGGGLMRILFSVTGTSPYEGHKATPQPGTQWMSLVAKQEPYPVKLIWFNNYGWGTQSPEGNKLLHETLPQLDFVITSEQIMNSGAELSDLVLPISSYYEEPFEVITSWSNFYVQARKQVISQMYESKTDFQVGQMLAEKFGILDKTDWKYDIEEWHRKFTIEGNIAMGKAGATHEEIVEAARIANADCFIQEAPEGYQTNIGDRGVKLSGGQRQRLSIARAVLKNPEILILDEATSALDTESEKLVQDALNKLLVGRTSVVIAHRLSTIHNADKIIVVDHGRVAEQGTHTELLAKGGIYAKLIELQSFD